MSDTPKYSLRSSAIALLFLSLAISVELIAQDDVTDSDATSTPRGLFLDVPRGERTFPPEVIRESGCSETDTPCLELAEIRYVLRLPDGFSRRPACVANTICVSETLSLRHDDFVAILDLVSPQIRSEWSNISMEDVLMDRVVLFTAESPRQSNGQMAWMDGGKFLVEQTSGRAWSILRQSIYHIDFAPSDRTESDRSAGDP